LVRVLPPVLSSEDGSKILENQKSAYKEWKMERQIYTNEKMINQYAEKINICHFENCEFSSDLKSSLKKHITKKHGPTENVSNTDKTLEEWINADETIQTTHATNVKAKVKSTDAEIDLIQMPGSSDIDPIDLTATEQETGGRRGKEEFACPYCEIVFDSKNEFTEHVVLHVEGYPCQTEGRNVKCLIPKCDAVFWTDGSMKQHLTKTHKMTKRL
jgi:uncharacterized C2H2 Zn-finger protein